MRVTVPFDAGDRDPFDDWRFAVGPWRPRPLSRRDEPMPLLRRVSLAAAIVVVHVALRYFAAHDGGRTPGADGREVTTLVFVAESSNKTVSLVRKSVAV